MNKISIALVSISAIFLVAGCDDNKQQTTQIEQAIQPVSQSFTLAAAQSSDLIVGNIQAPSLAAINSRKDSISFVHIAANQQVLTPPIFKSSSESDEFWMTVSGADLNNGVKLAISQPSSVIRVAPRADNRSGTVIKSQSISPEQLQLQKVGDNNNSKMSYIESLANPEELATAGLNDDSSALTLSSYATAGTYKLTVDKPLASNEQYLINVKEQGSPYQLQLSTDSRVSSNAEQLPFSLHLSNSQSILQPQASLKHANGRVQPLAIENVSGQWQAKLPLSVSMPNSNAGLSEIQINVQTQVNGQAVYRTVKTAFKQFVASAKLSSKVESQWHDGLPSRLTFNVDLLQAGRFGVNAALTGTSADGKDVLILTSQSAAWLSSDASTISLDLDTDAIKRSGLTAPFKLKALELFDQGQMARLSYQQQALTMSL